MSVIQPTAVLSNEHRLIERVLAAFEGQLNHLGHGDFPAPFFERALDFFANFADGCHHFKEEDALFPAMKVFGVPEEGGPIGVMLQDHRIGRAHLSAVRANLQAAAGGNAEAIGTIRDHGLAYVNMLRQHIWKEDNILFPMADRVLNETAMDNLRTVFADESNTRINAAVREKYAALAEELAQYPVAQIARA
jgi:hemerythrin-like domain-containing protein